MTSDTSRVVRTEPAISGTDRLLRVLSAFRDPRDELGVTDISTMLRIDKSVVHRNLVALTRHHFLERDATTRKYRVGLRAWEIGRRYTVHSWVEAAVPLLAELVQRTEGTAYVASLDGADVVYLGTVDGSGPFRVHVEVGARALAHTTALGRAILAELGDSERAAVLDQVDFAQDRGDEWPPLRPRREIEAELAATKKRGYSVNRGESRRGVGAVGAAIKDSKGRPIGAVSVGFPIMAEYEHLWDLLPREVPRVAADVSRRLA